VLVVVPSWHRLHRRSLADLPLTVLEHVTNGLPGLARRRVESVHDTSCALIIEGVGVRQPKLVELTDQGIDFSEDRAETCPGFLGGAHRVLALSVPLAESLLLAAFRCAVFIFYLVP